MQKLEDGEGTDCPCCGRYAKLYRRTLHSSVALQLIRLYQLTRGDTYAHASNFILRDMTGVGDFTKAKYWKLIEEKPHEAGDKKSSGFWKLTDLGTAFVEGIAGVPRYAIVFDDTVQRFAGASWYIHDSLGKKFSYSELMRT